MKLKSSARSPDAMVGNDLLDRADTLITEMQVRPRLSADARQEAVLALLEGRDPERAVRKFVDDDRACGMTGGGTRPTVLRLTPEEMDRLPAPSPEDQLLQREQATAMLDRAGEALRGMKPRQRQIVRMLAQGWTHAEIAAHLGVSQPTISINVRRLQRNAAKM